MTPAETLYSEPYNLERTYLKLSNCTPLMYAAMHGVTEFIEQSLSSKEKIESESLLNMQNAAGDTALHLAAAKGDLPTVLTLLKYGSSTNICSKLGRLPIHSLFSGKSTPSIEIFKQLCFKEPGQIDDEKILMRNGSGDTLAHLAAQKNAEEILNFIYVEKPELINATNDQLMTPLMVAILNKNELAASYLLDKSDPNKVDSKKRSILHYPLLYGSSVTLFGQIVNKCPGALNQMDHNGVTPIALIKNIKEEKKRNEEMEIIKPYM